MENSEMLAIFDKNVRRECEWTRMRRDVFPNLVRYTLTNVGHGGGYVSWSDLTSETADAAIESQIEYYNALGVDFEWKFYSHDQPADLPQRLLAHGFKAREPEALMVAELSDLAQSYWSMDVSAVTRVTSSQEVDQIVRMESEVWGEEISGFAAGMKYDLQHHPDHISVFAVLKDGRIVSAAWTHYLLSTSFATLWGGSTLAQYRRHGFYTALLAVRAREARDLGYRFLQVDASPNSQPILAKHGFRCLAYSTPYEWEPENIASAH
jgi:GNAT superfamily N-acetyltransferase